MFKNPLKYQEGGSTQNAMQQLVAWLVQNTGLDENQISQRLNQILSDDTAKQELVNNLQNMQKGDQNAAQNIIGMFVPQSAKFGGKIHDFICKHAHGGKTGCGCKQEGGSLEKSQKGITYNPYQIRLEQPENTWKKVNQMANISPNDINREKYWSLYRNFHGLPDPITVEEPLNNKVQGPKERLAGMESGGKVTKAQNGSGRSMWGPVYTDNNGRWRNFYDEYNGFAGTVNMNTGRAYRASTDEEILQPGRYNRKGYPIAEGASTNGTWYEVTPRGGILVNIPEGGQQVLHETDSTGVANLINQWDQSKVGHAVTAKENGGNLKKKENANVEMHQQKNKGRGKLSTPVSTTPKDSSSVEYNPSMQTLSFEDENGNNVTWTRNNFWGKPDGTYNWRSGRDMMFFDTNQNDGFIPYNKFKQWNTGIEGSTYLSPEDDARLKNLYEYARNKRTYIEPHYSWDSSIAERFWYWLKSLNRDKELTPGAPTFWEQTFKNGGKIK